MQNVPRFFIGLFFLLTAVSHAAQPPCPWMMASRARLARGSRPTPRSFRPRLERLEDRSVPAAPESPAPGMASALSPHSIEVQWTSVSDADGYVVGLTDATTGTTQSFTAPSSYDSLVLDHLFSNHHYYLDITAYNADGDSDPATADVYTPPDTTDPGPTTSVPSAPYNLSVYYAASDRVSLAWQPGSNDQTGFVIERATDGGDFSTLASVGENVTYYSDPSISAGESYTYRVKATGTGGDSPFSNFVTVSVPLESTTVDPGTGSSPPSATRPQNPFDRETNSRFVENLYRDVLGRSASSTEIDGWLSVLQRTNDRAAVARGFISSPEYRTGVVSSYYRSVLGREGSAQEVQGWVQGPLSLDGVLRGFLASDEYYGKFGGNPERYVKSLYRLLLGREGEPAGVQNWVGLLEAGRTREFVVGNIMLSQESINNLYVKFLHRNADPQGLAGFLGAYSQGTTLDAIKIAILASDEYFAR